MDKKDSMNSFVSWRFVLYTILVCLTGLLALAGIALLGMAWNAQYKTYNFYPLLDYGLPTMWSIFWLCVCIISFERLKMVIRGTETQTPHQEKIKEGINLGQDKSSVDAKSCCRLQILSPRNILLFHACSFIIVSVFMLLLSSSYVITMSVYLKSLGIIAERPLEAIILFPIALLLLMGDRVVCYWLYEQKRLWILAIWALGAGILFLILPVAYPAFIC